MTEMPAGADGGPEIDRYYSSGRTGPGRGLAGMAIGGGFERRMCRYPDIRPYLWGCAVGSIVFGIFLWVGRHRYVGYLGCFWCRQLHCCYARMEKSCVGRYVQQKRERRPGPPSQSVQCPPVGGKKEGDPRRRLNVGGSGYVCSVMNGKANVSRYFITYICRGIWGKAIGDTSQKLGLGCQLGIVDKLY